MDGSDDYNHPGGAVRVMAWVRHPFASDMSAMDWFLFLGLVLVCVFLWTRILSTIIEEV